MADTILLAVLQNFNMDQESIGFGRGLTLRRLSSQENKAFKDFYSGIIPLLPMGNFGLVFSKSSSDYTSKNGDFFKYGQHLIEKAISCLRIFKEGNFGVNGIALFDIDGDNYKSHMGSFNSDSYYGDSYNLLKSKSARIVNQSDGSFKTFSELDDFDEFRKIFYGTQISDGGFWSLAKNRFESSYGRKKLDDKLIDFTIGLEALFSEGPGDLRFKLSSRVARFLGEDSDKEGKIRISAAVKKIYDFRSNIVHGEASQDPDFEINVKRAEKYLRESLRKFVMLIKNHGENKDGLLRIIDFEM